jgi:hypothetical protein
LILQLGNIAFSSAPSEILISILLSCQGMSLKFPSPIKLVAGLSDEPPVANAGEPADTVELLQCFPGLFSDRLGTVKGMVCHLDLSDNIPVRSRRYQCSPPRLKLLREIVQDLLEKGVLRKSYYQYASPAFLVPKPSGGQRMVVDYRLRKLCLMPSLFPTWGVPLPILKKQRSSLYWT